MITTLHTERINIGYDGICDLDDIIECTKTLTDKFDYFFDEMDEEHYSSLCQECVPEHKTILYYLEIKMSEIVAPAFVIYFGHEYMQ